MTAELTPALQGEAEGLARAAGRAAGSARPAGQRAAVALAGGARTRRARRCSGGAGRGDARTEPIRAPGRARRSRMIARDSASLTALAAALAEQPADRRRRRRRRGAAGAGRWPAMVVRHFDEPDAAGVRRPGVLRRRAAASRWSAPPATRSSATPGRSSTTATWCCLSPIRRRCWCSRAWHGCGSRPARRCGAAISSA